ncbi:MAG: ABC transporter substrate-binding protein [Shimia sp.]
MVIGFNWGARALRRACAGLALLALAACGDIVVSDASDGSQGQTARDTSQPLQVALLLPYGTGNPQLENLARSLENAARLAASDLNASGVAVEIDRRSTQRNGAVGAAAAGQAIAAGADVIVGPLDGDVAATVGASVAASGTPVFAFSNNTAIAGGNVYLLGQTFDDSALRLARYARSQGKSRVLTIHAQGIVGEAGRAAVARALADAGLAQAGVQSFALNPESVLASAQSAAATAGSSAADAVFITSDSAGALGILLEELPRAGISPASTQYLGLTNWRTDPRIYALAGANGGWYPTPDPAAVAAFTQRYRAAYGSAPHPIAFTAYDGIAIAGTLWQRGGRQPFRQAAVTSRQGFQGAHGIIRFQPNGHNERGLAIGSVSNGQATIVDPAPSRFGGAGS